MEMTYKILGKRIASLTGPEVEHSHTPESHCQANPFLANPPKMFLESSSQGKLFPKINPPN